MIKYIPWRLQNKTNFLNSYSNFIFRKALKTKSISCNPNSDCVYITLTCHRDVVICILAIKSFLRFFSNIDVAIQDDGSLTEKDRNLLQKHIIGCQIHLREETDNIVKSKISNNLFTARSKDPSMLKLIDSNLLFDKKRIIADSDILFLKKPDEIIDWICSKEEVKPFYHQVKGVNMAFNRDIETLNLLLNTNIDKLDYCSGFIGFSNCIPIENITKTFEHLSKTSTVWGLEQNIFAFLLKEKSTKLNPDHYLAISEETDPKICMKAKMIHFIGKFKHKQYFKYGNSIINDLLNTS